MITTGIAFVCLSVGISFIAEAQRVESIDRKQFETYVWWLNFDQDQREGAAIYFERFTERSKEEFLPRSRAYHRRLPPISSETFWTAYEEMAGERNAFLADYAEFAEQLFADFAKILPDDELDRLDRVRSARQRHLYRTDVRELPYGRADLASLLVGLELTEAEWDALMPLLVEYEPLIIAALIKSHEAYIKSGPHTARSVALLRELDRSLVGEHRTMENHLGSPLYHQAQERLDEWARIVKPAMTHLAQLNRDWLPRFEAALSEENAAEYRRRFLETAYKPIDPDPAHAEALYQAAFKLENLSDEQRAGLDIGFAEFTRVHENISQAMRVIYDQHQQARTSDSLEERNAQFQAMVDLVEAGLERERLNESQRATIAAILTAEQMRELPEWDFERDPRPRPFDWAGQSRAMSSRDRTRRLREHHGLDNDRDAETDGN